MLGSRLQAATAALAVASIAATLRLAADSRSSVETGTHRTLWHIACPVGSCPALQAAAATTSCRRYRRRRRRRRRPRQPLPPLLCTGALSHCTHQSSGHGGQGKPALCCIRALRLRTWCATVRSCPCCPVVVPRCARRTSVHPWDPRPCRSEPDQRSGPHQLSPLTSVVASPRPQPPQYQAQPPWAPAPKDTLNPVHDIYLSSH